jgi:hypothetical protein
MIELLIPEELCLYAPLPAIPQHALQPDVAYQKLEQMY